MLIPEDIKLKRDLDLKFLNTTVRSQEEKAKTMRKVTITLRNGNINMSNGNSIYVSCKNSYFEVSRYVLLGLPTMVEQCLVDTLESTLENAPDNAIDDNTPQKTHIKKMYNIQYNDLYDKSYRMNNLSKLNKLSNSNTKDNNEPGNTANISDNKEG